MVFKIDDFKAAMKFGGARPHLFKVALSFPSALNFAGAGRASSDIPVKASATQIPASTVDAIPVFYQGRAVNFSGNRTYAPWAIEVINDEDFAVYDGFIAWLSALNAPVDNVRNTGFNSRPALYKSQATIEQYGQDEKLIKTWVCEGLFPVNVSEITLGWQDTNQIERFQVTFAVDAVVPGGTARS